MFSSICNYVKHKLAGKELGEYKTSVEQYEEAVQKYQSACQVLVTELESYKQTVAEQAERIAKSREEFTEHATRLQQADRRIRELEFELESVQQPVIQKEQVWVMSPEVYKKFCASFGQPVINGNSHADEAAFKLGQQSVLARIGEAYVSR